MSDSANKRKRLEAELAAHLDRMQSIRAEMKSLDEPMEVDTDPSRERIRPPSVEKENLAQVPNAVVNYDRSSPRKKIDISGVVSRIERCIKLGERFNTYDKEQAVQVKKPNPRLKSVVVVPPKQPRAVNYDRPRLHRIVEVTKRVEKLGMSGEPGSSRDAPRFERMKEGTRGRPPTRKAKRSSAARRRMCEQRNDPGNARYRPPKGKGCPFCQKQGHWAHSCEDYLAGSEREARRVLLGLCKCCLEKHGGDCAKKNKRCRCGKKGHHQALCPRLATGSPKQDGAL